MIVKVCRNFEGGSTNPNPKPSSINCEILLWPAFPLHKKEQFLKWLRKEIDEEERARNP